MSSPAERERVRRLRIRLAALQRHAAARDSRTGKSTLAVAAGQASGREREGDRAWGLEFALRRWHPKPETQKFANPQQKAPQGEDRERERLVANRPAEEA